MKRTLILIIAGLALALTACGGEDDDDNDNNGKGGKDMCGGLCIEGQYCWNGICVDGCKSNGDCAGDQFCDIDDFTGDGHCQNKTAPTGCTSNSQCEGTQVCKSGACVAKPVEQVTGCEWKSDMTDGCPDYEVCIQEEEDASGNPLPGDCYAMPACGETGQCPTDVAGAVCNEKADGNKIIPSKARICLMGLCLANTDCPSSQTCQTFGGGIGICAPEGVFDGCETDDDCEEGEECEPMSGMCIPDF